MTRPRLPLERAAVILLLALLTPWPQPTLAQKERAADEAPPAGDEAAALQPVPYPSLEGLDKAVADQLASQQDTLRQLLERAGDDEQTLTAVYGELGTFYHAYELLEAAQVCYENASHLAPLDARWPYYLGHIHQQAGRLEEAAASFRRVLELLPKDYATRVHLGSIYLELNRLDAAREVLEKALELDAPPAAAQARLGEIALSEKRYGDAVQLLEAAVTAVPAANRLHYPLALAYRGLGEKDKARDHLAQRGIVGLRPPDPLLEALQEYKQGARVHILRGRVAFRAGHYEEAAEAFRTALAAEPESAGARVNLASALVQLGAAEEALGLLREAVEREPESSAARYNLGVLLAAQGDDAGAIEHLTVAARLDQRDYQAALALGAALRRTGQLQAALALYDRALGLHPEEEEPRLRQAGVLVDLGRYRQAFLVLEAGHEMLPEAGRLAAAFARLLAACPDASLRDGDRALGLSQAVFQARPSFPHAENVALAYAELGDCAQAAEWQRRALTAAEGSPRAAALREALARYEAGPPCRPPYESPAP